MSSMRTWIAVLAMGALASTAFGQGFSDATNRAGLGTQYLPDPGGMDLRAMSGGVAVFDYDNDGLEDVFWPGGSLQVSKLFHNDGVNGDGDITYSDVAAAAGMDIQAPINMPSFADFDDDGDYDVFLTTYESFSYEGGPVEYRDFLMQNNGDGTFTDITAAAGLMEAGRWGASWGDLDGDGDLDLVTGTWSMDDTTHFFRNNGDLTFTDVTPPAISADMIYGFSPMIVDYDDDGDQDILFAADFQTSRVYQNQGTGFDLVAVNSTIVDGVDLDDDNGMGTNVADWNNDGVLDWFVSSIYSEDPPPAFGLIKSGNRLYVGNGDGTFSDLSVEAGVRDGGWGWGSQFCDLNNDGLLDIAHANNFYLPGFPSQQFLEVDHLRVFMHNEGDVMTDAALFLGVNDTNQNRGLVAFDYNDDGLQDLLVSDNDKGLSLYKNEKTVVGSWLEVHLQGTLSNSHGIGAKVQVSGDGFPTQTRWIYHGSNFLSQSPAMGWFGLNGTTKKVKVTVEWPSGMWSNTIVAPNQTVTIEEPTFGFRKPQVGKKTL